VKFIGFDLVFHCSQGFQDVQTHSLTHGRTDRPEYRMSPAQFFNSGGGVKFFWKSFFHTSWQ